MSESKAKRGDWRVIRFDQANFVTGSGAPRRVYGPYESDEMAWGALRQYAITQAEEERFNRPESHIQMKFADTHSAAILCDGEVIWLFELRRSFADFGRS